MATHIKLEKEIPKSLGTLSFDNNNKLLESTGIGNDRVDDIIDISQMRLDEDGYALMQDDKILVNVFKEGGKSVVVYTPADEES